MRTIVVLVLFSVISLGTIAQEQKQKLTRQERRELRKQKQEEQIKLISTAIENQHFVLEATNIKGKKGKFHAVNSNINFVAIDSTRAIFQLGSAHTIGINGLGGVTVEGQITSYSADKRKKSGSHFIKMTISATGGFYDISMNISSTGNASAQVMTMRGHRIEYSGSVVPAFQSRVFKGFSY